MHSSLAVRAFVALVLTSCVSAPAFAQGAPAALAECHAIQADAERLACYDRLTGRGAPTASTAPAVLPPSSSPAHGATGLAAPASPVVAESAVAAAQPRPSASLLEQSWGLEPDSPRYGLSWYRSNYLLVARWSSKVNNEPFSPVFGAFDLPYKLQSTEAKFQLSGKLRLWSSEDRKWSVYAAYTQQNQWQVYNENLSRPFRETNYMPEAFITYAPDWSLGGGVKLRVVNFGYTHQSNGRGDPLSRSWDRIFLEGGFERGNLVVYGRAWYRIPEGDDKDDNPDITDYYGHGEISALYRWNGNTFTGSLRGNVSKHKGAVQLGWFSRPLFGPVRGYVQFFSGYGESMIDYNWNQTTIGAGIALSDGL